MKQKTSAAFCIRFGLFSLLTLALLELNKNRVLGWVVALVLLAEYAYLRGRVKKGWARFGLFLGLVVLLAANLIVTQGPVKRHPAVEGKTGGATEIVTVSDGQLRGVKTRDGAVEVFAGIPYAAPPVGELRWREPQDPEAWEGVLEADTFAPMSMQVQSSALYNSLAQIIGYHDYQISLSDNFRDACSEDALYLNIWRPAGAEEGEALPVLVYVHGGSLQTGQPWYADYSGEGLARRGVIVVNMGYRLGVFGFLATEELAAESENGATGNYGLLDQIKALQWVQDNISAFGGDPDNVTLAGESAGSACVSALCTSPLAEGLFRRVIGESSTTTAKNPAHSFRTMEAALQTGAETLSRFGASGIDDLRQMDARTLVAAADVNHHITVDGYVLPETPYEAYSSGRHNEEAILHGFNGEEGTAFILFDMANSRNYEEKVRRYFGDEADEVLALYPAATDAEARQNWIDIYSAVLFTYGHHCWIQEAAENGIPSYAYFFTKENGRLGDWHSGEEVYLYHNIPAGSKLYDEEDRALSDRFADYVVNFMKTGDPNGEGLPLWEDSAVNGRLMELGAQQGMVDDPYQKLYGILERMQNNP